MATEFLPNPTLPADDEPQRHQPLPEPNQSNPTVPTLPIALVPAQHEQPVRQRLLDRHDFQRGSSPLRQRLDPAGPDPLDRPRRPQDQPELPAADLQRPGRADPPEVVPRDLPDAQGDPPAGLDRHPRGTRRAQPVRRQHHRLPRHRLHDDPVRQHRPGSHRRPHQDRLQRPAGPARPHLDGQPRGRQVRQDHDPRRPFPLRPERSTAPTADPPPMPPPRSWSSTGWNTTRSPSTRSWPSSRPSMARGTTRPI